jgi:hypothetical protein
MSTSQFNQTQRTAFENTLREKLREAQRALDVSKTEAEENALVRALEERGASELVETIRSHRANLESAEKELNSKGFELRHDGAVRISYDAPSDLDDAYEAFIAEATIDEKSKVEAISEALQNSWQIASVEEAKELVASLS